MLNALKIEKSFFNQGYDFVAGLDEAGRGPLAGPVVAACVMISAGDVERIVNDKKFAAIKDSKQISEKRRDEFAGLIMSNFIVGIGVCDHEIIDEINILQASLLAMKIAANDASHHEAIGGHVRVMYLIDGKMGLPNFSKPQQAIISGDAKVLAIAAASIIAKTERDKLMLALHEQYPAYCFDRHKGYGTKVHLEALREHGACEIHRKTFTPVSKVIGG